MALLWRVKQGYEEWCSDWLKPILQRRVRLVPSNQPHHVHLILKPGEPLSRSGVTLNFGLQDLVKRGFSSRNYFSNVTAASGKYFWCCVRVAFTQIRYPRCYIDKYSLVTFIRTRTGWPLFLPTWYYSTRTRTHSSSLVSWLHPVLHKDLQPWYKLWQPRQRHLLTEWVVVLLACQGPKFVKHSYNPFDSQSVLWFRTWRRT